MDNSDFFKNISDMEQAAANLGQFANFLSTYHKSLCDSGFQRSEALNLVKDFQKVLFKRCFEINYPEDDNYDN